MTDDEVEEIVGIAQAHRGRYLISLSDWLHKDTKQWQACDHLVKTGRARWLDIKRAGEDGEPGPGIQLFGPDFQKSNLS